MAVWNKYDNVVYITHNDTFGDTFVNKIYPCTFEGQIQNLQTFKLMTPLELIMIFSNNRIKIINNQDDEKFVEFTLEI